MSNPPDVVDIGDPTRAVWSPQQAALDAFKDAASRSPGYRAWLGERGINPETITAIEEVPYLVKQDVFSGDVNTWLVGGRVSGAAELLTSSGRGGMFSVGVSSRAEHQALEATADAALRAFGASEDSSTLLLNCLPMGIAVPTTIATVATPSVHLEMAQEIYERLGPDFDRVIVLAEPIFLKEFAERLYSSHGEPWSAAATNYIVGGEWVSESWRSYVGGLLGMAGPMDFFAPGILISMGAAELGLNLLFETPQLRALRSILDTTDHGASLVREGLGFTPTLFGYDPERLFIEERRHDDDATTLAFTALGRRLLPLVRYDLRDMAELVPADRVNAAFAAAELPFTVDGPIVAFWGRQADTIQLGGRKIRPERIKQRIFALAAEAAVLTGRFFVDTNVGPTLHLQLRPRTVATPNLEADWVQFLHELTGADCTVAIHEHDRYPFHAAGDFQHKPVYHEAL
jgi:phenylacetate-CoA ligase